MKMYSMLLETVDNMAVTPRHNKFINAILTSTAHVFCTVRRKEEYSITQNSTGKMSVQKMGVGEVTRDGFNYEMDTVFEITNHNHLANVTKDRTRLFVDVPDFLISPETGKLFKNWAEKGRSEIDDALDAIRNSKDLNDLTSVRTAYINSLQNNEDFITALKVKRSEFETK